MSVITKKELAEALLKHGRHSVGCSNYSRPLGCSCGLEESRGQARLYLNTQKEAS